MPRRAKYTLTLNPIMMKLNPIFIVTITICLLFPFLSNAQPPSFADDVEDVPVDGGLSLLIATGVGYGIKKLKSKKHKTSFENR